MVEKKGAGNKVNLRCINEKCGHKNVSENNKMNKIKRNPENPVTGVDILSQ
jgi:hypothetical protein